MAETEFKFALPSIVAIVPQVVGAVIGRVSSMRAADGSEDDIELAVQEALVNAVVHGNREDPFKSVYLTLCCSVDGEVRITVGDEGAGFDVASAPDPTAPEHLMSSDGRGIYLMRALMDEVSFEAGGSVVHLLKRQVPRNGGLQ